MRDERSLGLVRSYGEPRRAGRVPGLSPQGSEAAVIETVKRGAVTPIENHGHLGTVPRVPEGEALRDRMDGLPGRQVVAESFAMRQLLDVVRRVAPRDVTVLVRGETGTGKEVVASLLHASSRRSGRPLIRFNCAAIPDELSESALFGHVRGAFTGAVDERRGFFAEAHCGTLMLDEVGELPLPVQGTFLRALEDGEIQRVGSDQIDHVDVRVVACTNRDLPTMVEAGRFREDLYYRLNVVDLLVPPLREHPEDIPALVTLFACRYADRFGVPRVRLSAELIEEFECADWPGNIRQLENTVARMLALSEDGELPDGFCVSPSRPAGRDPAASAQRGAAGGTPPTLVALDATLTLREQVEAVEREIITRMLARVGGNRSEAARRLGVSRSAFFDKLRKLTFPSGE